MSKDVRYEQDQACDVCGQVGAYEFYGDFVCEGCLNKHGGQFDDLQMMRRDKAWEYLFDHLPFEIRHHWGGDWREFRQGVFAAAHRDRVAVSRDAG